MNQHRIYYKYCYNNHKPALSEEEFSRISVLNQIMYDKYIELDLSKSFEDFENERWLLNAFIPPNILKFTSIL